VQITFYGHSCFSIKAESVSILVDPFISFNPAAAHIDLTDEKFDYILLSHGHWDHIADAIEYAEKFDATVLSNVEVVKWMSNNGVKKTVDINFGGTLTADWGKIKYVTAHHSSSMPDGSYAGNPGGFVITIDDKTVYYTGDTSVMFDMKLIPMFNKIDLGIFCIGGYYTMDVNEAVLAAQFVETKKVMGVHYNTFPPIHIDTNQAIESFKKEGIELLLPEIGGSINI